MLRIPWMDRKGPEFRSNETCDIERAILETIKSVEESGLCLGYIMRTKKYVVSKLMIICRMEEKRGIGRKKHSCLRNLHQ